MNDRLVQHKFIIDLLSSHWFHLALRLLLIVYGVFHDANLEVPYTDIDYYVVSDGAKFILNGQSPFNRPTFRYTPLLALLVTPNSIFPVFGKVLFSAADVVTGALIKKEVQDRVTSTPNHVAQYAAIAWLCNPYTATISTRGNGDVIVVLGLVALLRLLRQQRHSAVAGTIFGILIHWRLFPVIYGPSIVTYIISKKLKQGKNLFSCVINKQLTVFGVFASAALFGSTAMCYHLYGYQYAYEAVIYHFSRVDHRHNFSPYFYPFYLVYDSSSACKDNQTFTQTSNQIKPSNTTCSTHAVSVEENTKNDHDLHVYLGNSSASVPSPQPDVYTPVPPVSHDPNQERAISRLYAYTLTTASISQILALLTISVSRTSDLALTWLLTTHAFVTLNKVSTAQYFVWYMGLAALVLPQYKPRQWWVTCTLCGVWVGTQLHWLLWAYWLEFKGQDVYVQLWGASLGFLLANVCVFVHVCRTVEPLEEVGSNDSLWKVGSVGRAP